MNSKILGLLCTLATVAGCDLATKTDWEGPTATCKSAGPAPAACVSNSECCSYACLNGVCAAGEALGAVCQTTNDCGTVYDPGTYSYDQMLCKGGHCANPLPYCRDLADVCTLDTQCCGGNRCTTGRCTLNRPPTINVGSTTVDAWPVRKAFTFTNTTTDPDGDTMVATWTLESKPALSTLTFAPSSSWAPSFTPDAQGAYVFKLVVTDQPAPSMTATATVTVNVVNLPPVVTPALAATSWQRNVGTLTIDVRVYDENSDPVDCAWTVCRPGTASCLTIATDPAPFTAPNAAPGQLLSLAFPTGLVGTQEGDWDVALACSDGSLSATGTTTVTVTNTPPTVTVPATRTFNLGVDAASTPDAFIVATATDPNGDVIDSWTWNVTAVPPGSAVTTASLGATASVDTALFKPDVTGDYTLTVRACDPAAVSDPWVNRPSPDPIGAPVPLSCTTRTVVATVFPYIRNLGHAVTDAAFYRGTSTARLVLAGPDSTAGAIWDYALPGATAPVKSSVTGAPNAVTITSDGNTAIVGDDVNVYKVALGPTPTVTPYTAPFSVGDVIALGTADAFVFPKTPGPAVYVQRMTISNGTFGSIYRYGRWGAAVAGTNDTFFVGDTYQGDLLRIGIQGQNSTLEASNTSYTAGKVWSTAATATLDAHIVASDGTIYAAPMPVASSTLTPLSVTLGLANLVSVDSSADASIVLAVAGGAGSINRYNGAFGAAGTISLPHWGSGGDDRPVEGLFAFVAPGATTAYAVVRTTTPPIEYGLYTIALP